MFDLSLILILILLQTGSLLTVGDSTIMGLSEGLNFLNFN